MNQYLKKLIFSNEFKSFSFKGDTVLFYSVDPQFGDFANKRGIPLKKLLK